MSYWDERAQISPFKTIFWISADGRISHHAPPPTRAIGSRSGGDVQDHSLPVVLCAKGRKDSRLMMWRWISGTSIPNRSTAHHARSVQWESSSNPMPPISWAWLRNPCRHFRRIKFCDWRISRFAGRPDTNRHAAAMLVLAASIFRLIIVAS